MRGGTEFVLNDAQYAGRSDAAQALFWWFCARVLKHHGEFLPLEYSDPKVIARLRGRTAGTTRKAVEELASEVPRPLVAKLPDGRLRIIGQRDKHGEQIGWIDEREEARAWNDANPGDRLDVEAFAEHAPQGRPKAETIPEKISEAVSHPESTPEKISQIETPPQTQRAEHATLTEPAEKRSLPNRSTIDKRSFPDVDVDLDVEADIQARRPRRKANGVPGNDPGGTATDHDLPTPGNVVEADWRRLTAIARHWPVGGRDGGVRRLGAILAANGPKDAEATVRMIDAAWKAGRIRAPWAALGKSEHPPPDEDPTPDRARGEPEQIGALLSEVGSGCDPPGDG